MNSNESHLSEEELKKYADYAKSHGSEISKVIEDFVESSKPWFKEYLIYLIQNELDEDVNEMTVYYQDYDKYGRLGELYADHTATYDEITIDDYLSFYDETSTPYRDSDGLKYRFISKYIDYTLSDHVNSLILKEIKKHIESIFNIQLSEDDFIEIEDLTDCFDSAYMKCNVPCTPDADFIANLTEIENMTLRDVLNYNFELYQAKEDDY